ncbi:hypothetical protein BDV40DRAFT_88341 [Aspergillus tamarii]|uniref:C2H2-type domain-containing protein n=1 Tax=Aspergillus tamarii TaxID=41984 RepID=A0A5N6V291_ASPTM|nr:hypothetical protein BDV40DRAFT_88341 [Aspergillus tamarii]
MSHGNRPGEREDVNSLPVSDIGDDVDFTLDPSLFDFSFPYIPPSTELCPVNLPETDQQLGQQLAPQPTFLDHGLDRENQLVSSGGDFIDSSVWLHTDPDLQRLHGLLPEVSSTIADDTSAAEPGVIAQESEPVKPGVSQGVSEQTNIPSSARTGLPRRRSRYLIRQEHQQSGPIFIPNSNAMDPMERWRESPPEDEPASISAILDALKKAPTQRSTQRSRRPDTRNTGHNAFRHYRRAPSATSGESSGSSNASFGSALSRSPSDDSLSRISKSRASKNTVGARGKNDKPRRFCCTFCCDKFRSRYDWARHEKSLHLNLEAWYCAPHGTTIFSKMTGRKHCAFCNALDPNAAHLDQHNHNICHGDSDKRRSFRRKDHLVQHLRLVHNVDTLPLIDDWKISRSAIPSRCGFCDHSMDTWEERVDHLAEHFRKSTTMKDWKGDHGFPPSIAAQVTNSLPPYLIAEESQSLIPFSATNTHVQDHFAQISSRAHYLTEEQKANPDKVAEDAQADAVAKQNISMSELSSFTQVLTLHLSRYAQEKIRQGVMPTDDMFQQEARRVLYDSEDSWNQTIADNPEWLSAFRHLHCAERNNIEPRLGELDRHLEDTPQTGMGD